MVLWLMACLQSGGEDSIIRKEGGTESGGNTDSQDHSADSPTDSRGDSGPDSVADSTGDSGRDSGRPDSQPDSGEDSGIQDQAADFLLADVNSASPRYGELVSPRDYLQQVSGWYFIHST
ncbi:MAG TPA: hypothetical protein PKY30_08135 [Myxococcota bacterium]|nr:hypothetical protein [Myxococcota bacterium]